MVTYPHGLDPITGEPATKIRARGNEIRGIKDVLHTLRRMEDRIALPPELRRLEATSVAGMRGRSSQVVEDIVQELTRQKHQYRVEVHGQSAVRFHLLGRGAKGGAVGIGAIFDLPIELGGMVKGLPKALIDPATLDPQSAVRISDFIGRGRFVQTAEGYVPSTWVESVGYDIRRQIAKTPTMGDEGLRELARGIEEHVKGPGYQGLLWSGAKRVAVTGEVGAAAFAATGYQGRTGSIYDLFQMGTVGIHRAEGVAGPTLISEFADLSKFPFGGPGGREFDPSHALRHVKAFVGEAEALGLPVSDRAIKAESALAGNLGLWKMGEIVPFGETGDPSRQAYQRLAIAQLAGRRGRHVAPVSTPIVEAMKRHAARTTGGSGRWTVESRIALVMDPRFEQAVGGAGGGAIVTPRIAQELSSDITQMANYEKARWLGMMERGGGRVISRAGVGTSVITSFGTKHTIASIREMTGAGMAIGWSSFLKGKNPEALREAVIRDVMDQMMASKGPGPGYTGPGGKYVKSSIESRMKFQRSLIDDISKVFDSTQGETVRQGIPQLLVGPEAAFSSSQQEGLSSAIDKYNRQLRESGGRAQDLGLQEIRKGFEISSTKIGGTNMRAMFMQASVMRRLEAAEVVTKAVGAWTRPAEKTAVRGFSDKLMYMSTPQGDLRYLIDDLYHPRGIKMGLNDLTNLELYKTKEASQLSELYTKYIKDWSRFEKEQFYSTTAPFFGVPGKEMSALGFPDIKGAMEHKEFVRKYGGRFQQTTGKGIGRTAGELAGTMFEPSSPLRGQGMAIKLPWEIEIGGVPKPGATAGEIVSGIPTRQMYLPSVEAYRGIFKDPSLMGPESAAYVGKLERAHERLFLSLAVENPNKKRVEALARQYHNTLGAAFGGKAGLLSYLSTARMAHSGYLGLVPGGVGPAAKALGTALDSPFMAQISETTARDMGVHHLLDLGGKKSLYGRVTTYPGIGPTMESVLQFKMVKDSELGSKRLRLSNLMALIMFRDFDMDKAGVTFLMGDRAQHLSKQFYEKTVIPRMKWYEQISREDPELAAIMGEESPYYKQLARNVQETRQGAKADIMDYNKALVFARAKTDKFNVQLAEAIERKYTTKVLTGPVSWYIDQFRLLAEAPGIGKDITRLGMQSTNLRQVGGVLGLIKQQATITKGEQVAGGVQGLFRLMSAGYEMETEAGRKIYASAIEEGERHLYRMTGADPKLVGTAREAAAVYGGVGGRGEARWLSTQALRRQSMQDLLAVGQVRHALLAQMTGETGKATTSIYPTFMRQMAKGPEVEAGFHSLGTLFMDISDRQAALSGDGLQALNRASQKVTEAAGFTKSMGLEWGTDLAGVEARAARRKTEEAAMAELNQFTKMEGRAARMTILDRATKWWTRTETPYWQKAGVITGAAILLGAVAKNALFPGYGGADRVIQTAGTPVGPPPIIIAPPMGGGYQGPTGPTMAPHRAHRKPGGLWAYVQDQVGFGPESYGLDTGRGHMPMAKPIFGPRKYMPGVGLDLGPGIADSDSRPMMLTGPPVGGGAPLPPAMPATTRVGAEIPYTTPIGEPPARMSPPEHMRGGMMVSAMQPAMGGMPEMDISEIMQKRLGGEVNLTMDRWDTGDGIINRMVDINSEGLSSFT